MSIPSDPMYEPTPADIHRYYNIINDEKQDEINDLVEKLNAAHDHIRELYETYGHPESKRFEDLIVESEQSN